MQESFQGIREVIFNGSAKIREDEFARLDIEFRQAQTSSVVLSQAPRYIVESLLVTVLVGIALSQAGTLSLDGDLLPSLGVLALGVQRIMPLAQAIYANLATMKGAEYSVYDVLELARTDSCNVNQVDHSRHDIDFQDSIEVRNVAYRYPGAKKNQLKDIQIKINASEWIGFYGQTGSGKSTILDVLSGLLSPTSGYVLVDGKVLDEDHVPLWQRKIAVVSQSTFFSDESIQNNLVPKGESIDLERLHKCLKVAQLEDTMSGFNDGLDTRMGEAGVKLSGGQLQRLSIARALYKQADVLILDEATSALDQETESHLMSALKQYNSELTVIMVAHRLNTLSGCDRLYYMADGKVISSGTYQDMISSNRQPRSE